MAAHTDDASGSLPDSLVVVRDEARVRTITLNRPEALNAFNEALYDATTDALLAADADAEVAAVLLTGSGRAFSAGTDVNELAEMATNPDFVPGRHGFLGLVDALAALGKPLIVAVNGVGLGIGVTVLGYADLAFMATTARLKCPFTSLGVAPEAASSYLLPQLMGRQNAAWLLLSSEWLDAEQALRMGLVWQVCEPDALLAVAHDHAARIACHALPSLRAVKQAMLEPYRDEIAAARARENALFATLLGTDANLAAMRDFTGR
jgi:enoyl-CoA hydratase/carnithine racemase